MTPEWALPEHLTDLLDQESIPITISDSALPDCPLVYVNQPFAELTGYSPVECLGRNCRFLQGDETDRETVHEVREAIDARRDIATCLMNYTKMGEPFRNLLVLTTLALPTRPRLIMGCQFRFSSSVRDRAITGQSKRLTELQGRLARVQHDVDTAKRHTRIMMADALRGRIRYFQMKTGI